jgi:outer membrane protein assembly factor BamA
MVGTGVYTDAQFALLPGDESAEFSNNVRVFCLVSERNRFGLRMGVDQQLDQSTPTGNISFNLLNPINGLGETLEVSLSKNARGTVSGGSIQLRNLHNTINSKVKYHLGIERNEVSRDWVSGFNHKTDRIVIGGSTYDNISTVEYELALRKANPIVQQPEAEIIESAYQPDLKSTFRLIHQEDFRDSPIEPRRGKFYRASAEVSGLIGDSSAGKVEVNYQQHVPLTPYSTLSCTLRSGIQQPLRSIFNILTNKNHTNTNQFDVNKEYPDIPIYDRFFLGSLHTRGLKAQDLGPKAGRHAFGSDAYVSGTASVAFTIPNLEDVPIRPHVFFNVSQLLSISTLLRNKYGGVTSNLTDQTQLAASIGAGLVFPTVFGRLELNVASQLKNKKIMKPSVSLAVSGSYDW